MLSAVGKLFLSALPHKMHCSEMKAQTAIHVGYGVGGEGGLSIRLSICCIYLWNLFVSVSLSLFVSRGAARLLGVCMCVSAAEFSRYVLGEFDKPL